MLDLSVLPRDMQVLIFRKCDMDTRIKGGIIGRLVVPSSLQAQISNCIYLPTCLEYEHGQQFYIWKLGRDDHPTYGWLYTVIKEIDANNGVMTSVYNRYCHHLVL